MSELCRGPQPPHPFRREFVFGPHGWDVDSDGTEDAGPEEFVPDVDHFPFTDRPTLGSRIGSSLREAHPGASSLSQWRPLDLIFSPPNRTLDNPSPPPPPAPSTRPNTLLSMMPGRSSSSLVSARQSLTRRPASASGATYFRPRHRATDFESQTQQLRDRARTRDLLDYMHIPSGSASDGASGSQVPPESFARRSSGPSDDESDPRPSGTWLALPPAPVPAHAHAHSGPSHSTIRRVTSELSSLDRTIEARRRELSAAREDFAARFRRGVSNLTPVLHRSPSPVAVGTQPRESLRAALWGAGPRDEEGLPTPRSMTPELGERGAAA